jgi:pilus assembly protein CpaE
MKILALTIDPAAVQPLTDALTGAEPAGRTVLVQLARPAEIAAVVDREQPDLVILDRLCQTVAEVAILETPAQRRPGLAWILIAEPAAPELLVRAMQLGVKDVLPPAASAELLDAAVRRVERAQGGSAAPRRRALVAAFMACKGGAGATFIAANVAHLLATEYGRRTALVDLDLGSSDASLFVASHGGTTTIADLTRNVTRLDAALLSSSMLHVGPNLDVLEAPDSLERAIDVTAERVVPVLTLLESLYDCVVLNLGRPCDAVAVGALDRSHHIFPVLQLTVPFIRDAKRLLSTLQALGVQPEIVHLVVNRYESGSDIALEDLERTLGRKAALIVPNNFKLVSASVNQGIPVAALDARASVTRRLRELIEEFLGGEPRSRNGWLANLLRSA